VIQPRVEWTGYPGTAGTRFLVQVESNGSEIDPNAVFANDTRISTLPDYSYTELSRLSLGGFGGFRIQHAWTFTLPGGIEDVRIDWGWGVTSSSLGQVLLDSLALDAACPGDLDGSGSVDLDDLLLVLGNFGCSSVCGGDADRDGDADLDDLLVILGSFGASC
jgi:hypothetical protein